jgi:uncharacterized membrane protein YidH (DUF202 family)
VSRPGLAVERTVLAWTRTWLSVAVCGLLLFRISTGSAVRIAAALAAGAGAVLLSTVAGRRRTTRLRAFAGAGVVDPATRAAALTTATVAVFALAAAALVLTH